METNGLQVGKTRYTHYSIASHLGWIPKYRRKILTGEVQKETKRLIGECCQRHGLTLLALETDIDHIPVFGSRPPRFSPAMLANLLKGHSSRYLRERFPHLKKVCGKDHLWTQSYDVGTAGAVSAETIKRYIVQCQGQEVAFIPPPGTGRDFPLLSLTMAEKITIRDIARLAGVSKATVSRVLNQKPDVDPATRERILRIMEERAFLPSITAPSLAGGRSRLIGVLIPSLTWPLIPEIMRGVSEMMIQSPYELLLYSITREQDRNEKDQGDVIDHILATGLAASLLAVFPGQSAQHLTRLHEHGFPLVMIDDQGMPSSIPWVGADNRAGGYAATRYLLHLGHRRIAHISGPLKYLVSHERSQGYCEALREAGITPDPALVMEGDFMPSGGRTCAGKLLALEDRPTAIFAANDQMAYGVLAAAEESGLRVPEDLSLIGFDDIPLSAHTRPALTTVRQPFYEMGQRAIALLLFLLELPRPLSNGQYPGSVQTHASPAPVKQREPIRLQLATDLVVRASCSTPQALPARSK